jgi:hypothetical protein
MVQLNHLSQNMGDDEVQNILRLGMAAAQN